MLILLRQFVVTVGNFHSSSMPLQLVGEDCNKINQDFMEVSEKCGIKFFPGSYSPALKNKEDEEAYPKRIFSKT